MNREVYRYLLGTYGKRYQIWVGYVLVAMHTFLIRVLVVIIMAKVASSIASGDASTAKRYALVYLLTYIIGALLGVIGELVSHNYQNLQYAELTKKYHRALISKDMAFYRDNQTGYLASMFRQHLDAAILLVRFWHGEAMGTIMSLTLPAVVLLVVAPKVGFVALAVIFVQVLYVLWASSKAASYRQAAHEIYRKLTGEVSDEITNIVAFKSGGIESRANRKIDGLISEEVKIFWKRRKTGTLLDLPRGIITSVGITAAVMLIISNAEASDPKTLGVIVLTLTYMFQIVRSVVALPELIATHDDLVSKLSPTLQYLHGEHETITDPAKPKKLTITKAAIDFRAVSFSYPSHSKTAATIPVFKELEIHIAGGEQVGIVGLSGAGKSTLAHLLLRFDEVGSGAIEIDGIDIREVRQSELRQSVAYVPQEPLLFHRSIRENIAYFAENATDTEVIAAAKAAHAHDFIEKLPDGYETIVGERGIKLSGGQKQRVAIARAILKKAPIMLFDEATSALDSESEQIIQKALPKILGKHTAIIVAHRLSTVAGLDRIIVMHDGRIEEQGTHEALLRQKGRYYTLWQKQTQR